MNTEEKNFDEGKMTEENQSEKKSLSREKTVALILAGLAAFLVIAAAAGFFFLRYSGEIRRGMFQGGDSQKIQQVKKQCKDPDLQDEELKDVDWIDSEGNMYQYRDDVVTVLLMGIDYNADPSRWSDDVKSNGGNADVIALAILDTAANELCILNIPRDTMARVLAVDAEGNYKDTLFTNITTAHSYGDGGTLSCELTVEAVSNLLYGIPINRYAAISYSALATLNQAIGGLEITLERDYTNINAAFTEGATVRLTDYQLKRMVVYRDHSELEGAYERGLRDMSVMQALFEQCKELVKEDPGAVLTLYGKLADYITTDLRLDEISYLAQQTVKNDFSAERVIAMQGEAVAGERYVEFYPNEQWLHDFVAEQFCREIKRFQGAVR